MKHLVLISLTLGLMACGDKSDDTAGSEDSTGDTTEETSGEADLANGQVVHDERCMACHASNPDMETKSPSLTDEELEAVIQTGSGSMPGQGLNATDLRDVIAYIRATYG